MGIIDIFMPSRDGINRITIVRITIGITILNRKTAEIRHQINKLYPIDKSQRKNAEV